MRRVYPRGALAAQVLGFVGTEGKGLRASSTPTTRSCTAQRASGAWSATRSASRSRSPNVAPEQPGAPIALTLDANIQQRAEDVLGAVGRVFHPEDATAIVMDPRTGAILAMANWPQLNPNDPAAVTLESAREPRGELRLRTGLDLQGRRGLRRAGERADHAQHAVQHPRPDPGRQPHDPRRRRTPRRDAHDRARSSPSRATSARSRSARWRAPNASTVGAPIRLRRRRPASACRARKRARRCRWTNTRAPRWATCRSARASS